MAAVLLSDAAVSATLVAATADTVTITPAGPFEITNLDPTNAIWVRLDGQAATIAGPNCIPVLGARARAFNATPATTVSVFPGAGTPQYTVSKMVGGSPSM